MRDLKPNLDAFLSKISIGKKIIFSFLIIIVVNIFNGFYTVNTLRSSMNVLNTITSEVNPALKIIDDFKTMVKDARTYSTNWVYVGSYQKDKEKLLAIHEEKYPDLKHRLISLLDSGSIESDSLAIMISAFEGVLEKQKEIIQSLNNSEAYEDPMVLFISEDLVENEIIPVTDDIIEVLDAQLNQKMTQSTGLQSTLVSSFEDLNSTVILLGIVVIVFALTVSYLLYRSITKPIRAVYYRIDQLKLGIIPKQLVVIGTDEISRIANAVNSLISGFQESSEFARHIKAGNLEAPFTALSNEDVLGLSLISMRDNLKGVINETNRVVTLAGEEGKLSARIDINGKEGAWKELCGSINELLSSIANPVLEINRIISDMAQGDLTSRYTGATSGDISLLVINLNKALENLNQLLMQISESTDVVGASSEEMQFASAEMTTNTGEIASAIAQMSNGAQEQVNKIDEVSKLLEQILRSSAEMGAKASEIKESATIGVENSDRGEIMVESINKCMEEINGFSEETSESINVLSNRSAEITRVLSVITEIAAQTNLLALNAAIEAAQAGDAGRGFAVVAEEIRKLAEDSKHSAQEIKHLVDSVKTDTQQATAIMATMQASVEAGRVASKNASNVFTEIFNCNQQTLSLSEDIYHATLNQKEDMNQVVSITEGVVVIAEQTASGSEEVATSAAELSSGMDNYNDKSKQLTEISSSLQKEVSKFKLTNHKPLTE